MLVRRLGVSLVVGVALAGCAASATDTALADVRQACTNLGYKSDGSSGDGSSASSGETWDAAKWSEAADGVDDVANQAARAARADQRWDRLSNAITDLQSMTDLKVDVEDPNLSLADRNNAQAKIDQIGPDGVFRTLDQECRKALAQ